MNNRDERVVLAAKSAVVFARGLNNAPPRITDAANRLQAAIEAVFDAGQRQSHAKNTLRVPGASVNRAKELLLRKHLDPIAADGLEMFAGLPGIEDDLRLPRIKDPPQKHFDAAKRIREVAAQHEQEFISERNYPEDFLERFDRAVETLQAAMRVDIGSARASYTRATADVRDEMARLRRAFDVLDTRIRAEYLGDRNTLGQWRGRSRVPGKIGRPKKRKSGRKPLGARHFPKLVAPEDGVG